jgi:TetR/AcrR family transcriptional regulator, transcriptional repressor for nem operon
MARPAEFDRTKALEQAMNLFWCQGYEATSTQDLMQMMGLKPGSLYNTFHDKHSLYLEALDLYQQTVGACLFAVLDSPLTGKTAIEQFFAQLVDESVNDPEKRGCFMVNATLEMASHDKDVAQRVENSTCGGQAMFLHALQKAQSAGEIRTHQDLKMVAAFLMTTVQGIRVAAKVNNERSFLQGIVNVALSTLS